MNPTQNIGMAFLSAAKRWPDKDAIIAEDFAITYGNLERVVSRFALRFQNEGVGRGSVVGIDTADAIVMVSSVFALSLLGAAFTTVGPEFRDEDPIGLTHAFRTEDRPGPATVVARLLDDTYSPKVPYLSLEPLRAQGFQMNSDTAWVLCSSGTTGKPKAVNISAATLWRRVAVAAEDYGESINALCMIFRPFARPYPIRAVAALLHGTPLVDSQSPAFMRQHGVDLVCASKQQAHEWLQQHLPFSARLQRIQVSGARLFDKDIARFFQGFEIVEDVYGSNETIASEITIHQQGKDGVSTARRNPQSEVEVVDANDKTCPAEVEGSVRIRSAFMVQSYVNSPIETAKRFRDGWFYPGDAAKRDAQGILHVLGREDDVANLGGTKLHLAEIDQSLSGGIPGMASSFVVPPGSGTGSEELAALVKAPEGVSARDAAAMAWTRCAKDHGIFVAPKRILIADALPLAADGTPKRKAARKAFLNRTAAQESSDLARNLFAFDAEADD